MTRVITAQIVFKRRKWSEITIKDLSFIIILFLKKEKKWIIKNESLYVLVSKVQLPSFMVTAKDSAS